MEKKRVVLKLSLLVLITMFLASLIFVMYFRDGLIIDSLGIHMELPLGKK